MTAFEQAFVTVQELVTTFDNNYSHYMSSSYSEADARKDFIDKFFAALGWDINHDTQTNPYEQKVKIERSQKQQNESSRKRADYAFFLAPNFKDEAFFVEAKKPSVLIENNPQHYFQTMRYGWNAGCPVSALTDFEEFVIIDCRSKPDIKHALSGKHKSYRYTDYADKEKFGEIYWLFSHEAVAGNSIKKYAEKLPRPKGKTTQKALFKGGFQAIDETFLEYMDGIRESLAKAFKKSNDGLNSEQLTEAVHRTLDRLVFIRFLEDKFIETESHVNQWGSNSTPSGRSAGAWKDFVNDCRKLDVKYNGVVFKKHFIDEQNFAGAEDRLFTDICQDMSSLHTPFDFNYIPIHILGSIYERFLGKVVRATAKKVFVEEKPEVRKAGGVYYTPKYIVDYIVESTVGKQIQGKTPRQIAGLRFADIACGSGSFLIGVYEFLLDYHVAYYQKKYVDTNITVPQNGDVGLITKSEGKWHLTLKLKQQILLNNIYGVDIDYQAVEVTQLSLFLKLLEDESYNITQALQGKLFSKVLPDLSKNIVCGNSLIGFDVEQMNGGLFNDEELDKLNPLDFQSSFRTIMQNGGFDAIVGNPPYIPIEVFSENERKYYQKNFKEFTRKYDSSAIFISKALKLLNKDGLLAYISTQTWETGENYAGFRKTIFSNYGIKEIVNLPFNIFKDAYIDTGIFIFSKRSNKAYRFFAYKKKEIIETIQDLDFEEIKTSEIKEPDYKIIFNNSVNEVLKKISTNDFIKLGEISISTQGLSESRFKKTNSRTQWVLPFINADVKRYLFSPTNNYFVDIKEMQTLYTFYEAKEKILIRRIINRQDRLDACFFDQAGVFKKDLNPFVITNEDYDTRYILALINSRLFSWIYLNSSSIASKDDFRQTTLGELRKLPVRKISKQTKHVHDTLVSLVAQMLHVKKQPSLKVGFKTQNLSDKKIQSLETKIDSLVYQLYGLTEEEIKIVEGVLR